MARFAAAFFRDSTAACFDTFRARKTIETATVAIL